MSVSDVPHEAGAKFLRILRGVGPVLAGSMLAASTFGWPLVIAGATKIVYDVLLLAMFRNVKAPEERGVG